MILFIYFIYLAHVFKKIKILLRYTVYPALSPPPPTGGSPAQPHQIQYIMNNYLGFIHLGVAIPNKLFAALTRFLSAITIAFFSLWRLLLRFLRRILMRISIASINSIFLLLHLSCILSKKRPSIRYCYAR